MRCHIHQQERTACLACALLAIAVGVPGARAADLDFTIGAKLWANEWSSWQPTPTGTNTIDVVESIAANTTLAPILQGSVTYKRWLLTASYFTTTDYSLGGSVNPVTGNLGSLSASRTEVDANVGYFIAPGFAATIGYKHIEQRFAGAPYSWSGPTVGLSAGAPVYQALAIYATFAYGRLTLSAPSPDAAGSTSFDADYFLGELGLSYGFDTPLSSLSLTATLGYRIQIVATRGYAISTGFDGYEPVDLHDVTYGPALGLSGRF